MSRSLIIAAVAAGCAALVESLDVRLLTEDRELLRKFPKRAVSLEMFCKGSK